MTAAKRRSVAKVLDDCAWTLAAEAQTLGDDDRARSAALWRLSERAKRAAETVKAEKK